jgi:L-lactate dehydrogenase complex protein LldF
MNKRCRNFLAEAEQTAFDPKHQRTIRHNLAKYHAAFDSGKLRYTNLELSKLKVSDYKRDAINQLDKYLKQFVDNAVANQIDVHFAETKLEARTFINQIVEEFKIKTVVKSKSMLSEELELNHFLAELGVTPYETDLGEFIVQTAGERPYHLLTPAMHKSKEDVARLFSTHFGTPADASAVESSAFARGFLRQKYVNADLGISGANFLIADSGAIGLTENEGNGLMTTAFPKVHLIIAGIEKVVPSFDALPDILPVLAQHGTGQAVTAYNSVIFGSRTFTEVDGPEKTILLLLDNGRNKLLSEDVQFSALSCIRCGACLNFCPVYQHIGGYTYGSVYGGPIGSIISLYIEDKEKFEHLAFACSLCGRCAEVCPAKINLPELMLQNRADSVCSNDNLTGKLIANFSSWILMQKWLTNLGKSKFFYLFVKGLLSKYWGKRRAFPEFHKQD